MSRKCTDCGEMTVRMAYNEPKDYKVLCEICSRKCIRCGVVQVYADGNKICSDCVEKENPKPKSTINIIDNTKYGGTEMNEAHYKHLNTRCIDDKGNSLSGRAGLKYMESKGDTYAKQLKSYYK